ncbi:MAG: YggS family pyridoxal phosphate-dependent enzyme [Bacteroidales bacterium]|nr:YggS family pyridoxal phosphate-dependent enzyme [Bacteroidales bacterium]
MSIAATIQQINQQMPEGTRLVAISKYHPSSMIQEAYDAGQRIFGESHVQELQQKVGELPGDIEWHFIGHLQTNKVKYIAPYVALVHAVDTLKLMAEIEKQAAKCNRTINILLQLHVAQEETKFGFTPEECDAMLAEGQWKQMPHVCIKGIMCMASNVDDEEQVAAEFERAHQFFLSAKQKYFASEPSFCECSMGMSDDYQIAIQHGSTLVRIGSKIFGPRVY